MANSLLCLFIPTKISHSKSSRATSKVVKEGPNGRFEQNLSNLSHLAEPGIYIKYEDISKVSVRNGNLKAVVDKNAKSI